MSSEQRVKVWDIAVRLFHWSLVVLFFVAYFSGELEGQVHALAGYAVLALLAFRVVWGVVGTRYARFSDFVYGPSATLQYVRSLLSGTPRHYLGHNPLGGWMVVALLVVLLGASWSGLEAYALEGHGPLAGVEKRLVAPAMANDDEREGDREGKEAEGDEFWEEIHEFLSHVALLFVVLHIVGVLIASAVHRENLVRAMITGYKTKQGP